jgi:hypothetical protein
MLHRLRWKTRLLPLMYRKRDRSTCSGAVSVRLGEVQSDDHACEFVKGLCARPVSDVAYHSHQVARDTIDARYMSEPIVPTVEIVAFENEHNALSINGDTRSG